MVTNPQGTYPHLWVCLFRSMGTHVPIGAYGELGIIHEFLCGYMKGLEGTFVTVHRKVHVHVKGCMHLNVSMHTGGCVHSLRR